MLSRIFWYRFINALKELAALSRLLRIVRRNLLRPCNIWHHMCNISCARLWTPSGLRPHCNPHNASGRFCSTVYLLALATRTPLKSHCDSILSALNLSYCDLGGLVCNYASMLFDKRPVAQMQWLRMWNAEGCIKHKPVIRCIWYVHKPILEQWTG
jgi:hypothetical protein